MSLIHHDFDQGTDGKAAYIFHTITTTALTSGGFSTLGLLTYAEGLQSITIAVLTGVATFFLFSALWRSALQSMTSKTNMKARVQVLGLSLLAAPFIIGLSSTLNATAIAGELAQRMYIQKYITTTETTLTDLHRKSEELQSLGHDFDIKIDSFEKAAVDENSSGRYSGTPGTGGVHTALLTIAHQLTQLRQSLTTLEAENITHSQQAENTLDNMRSVMHGAKPIALKVDAMASHATHLGQTLIKMNSNGLAESMLRTLNQIPNETQAIANLSKNTSVKANQKQALIKLRAHIQTNLADLNERVENFLASPLPPLPAFERISPNRAVITMWKQLPSAWAASLAMDLLPYFFLLYLMISASSKSPLEDHVDALKAMPMGNIIHALQMFQILRNQQVPAELEQAINKLPEDDNNTGNKSEGK